MDPPNEVLYLLERLVGAMLAYQDCRHRVGQSRNLRHCPCVNRCHLSSPSWRRRARFAVGCFNRSPCRYSAPRTEPPAITRPRLRIHVSPGARWPTEGTRRPASTIVPKWTIRNYLAREFNCSLMKRASGWSGSRAWISVYGTWRFFMINFSREHERRFKVL